MAQWGWLPDRDPVVEPPNAVAYITFSSDDGRQDKGVRVPYAKESDLLNFLTGECARRSAMDDRNDEMTAVVASSTLIVGKRVVPDISVRVAAAAAQSAYIQQLNTAIQKKLYNEALEIDPTLADAKSSAEAAQADLVQNLSVVKG